MRMLRPAFAVAALLLVMSATAQAGDLLRPIARSRRSSIITSTRASARRAIKPAAAADDATLDPPVDARPGRADSHGRRVARLCRIDRSRQAGPAGRPPDGVARLRSSPGDRARHDAHGRRAREACATTWCKAVGENRPWDRIFRELMLPDQTDKVQKVAAEYLRQRVKDLDRLTADVSSTFFGVNISCAQCHDHPLVHDWKQDHFYGMKAFLEPHVRQRQRKRGLPGRARLRHHPVQDDRGRGTSGPDDVLDRPAGRRARCEGAVQGGAEEGEGGARPRQEREGSPAAAEVQRPGQAGGGGARSPANASSSPGRSSIASGTGSSARDWSCRWTRCTRRTRPAIPSCSPGWPATLADARLRPAPAHPRAWS